MSGEGTIIKYHNHEEKNAKELALENAKITQRFLLSLGIGAGVVSGMILTGFELDPNGVHEMINLLPEQIVTPGLDTAIRTAFEVAIVAGPTAFLTIARGKFNQAMKKYNEFMNNPRTADLGETKNGPYGDKIKSVWSR